MSTGVRQKTGGRQKGTPNKSTAEIKKAAQVYGPDALRILAEIMVASENDQARISAAKELLDRGFGKSTQPIEHSGPDGEAIETSISVIFVNPDGTSGVS